MIVASITVLAVLMGATSALASFNDTSGNPFEADIDWMAAHGIAGGFSDGGYHPTASVSRGSMAAFIHRLNQQTQTVNTPFSFTNQVYLAQYSLCPAGKSPVGGGGSVNITGEVLYDSFPTANGWAVAWQSATGAPLTGGGNVYVICQASN